MAGTTANFLKVDFILVLFNFPDHGFGSGSGSLLLTDRAVGALTECRTEETRNGIEARAQFSEDGWVEEVPD
jgi:hypothetical protein